ncbi:hypothetical protein COU19_03395 [Candidatus Kaiserbacteria bacterium CG10_big_fil_rev_8_21_14_0_10_56_12]|uniref:Uncharacterized protein n=1 Tax=Candidatus Kaiserbacteria bacterium CG10_big_fil_rev_8_21_14_0_10_56_12 TaxID=1974611 RepID=A0A2H0U905_9BACT|nr:MAG: hypothetical protein COU19_03395 [Candidatus Kaiserbacteria bacterium CG10_big_fil_rev_8_21_14_0_10_56_12]
MRSNPNVKWRYVWALPVSFFLICFLFIELPKLLYPPAGDMAGAIPFLLSFECLVPGIIIGLLVDILRKIN